MGVGAIGAYSGITFNPYVYNTNHLNRASLSKVPKIPNNLLSSKTDFSGMTKKAKNVNPLRPGETKNFADIMAQQFQKARNNAARIMKPAAQTMHEAKVQ